MRAPVLQFDPQILLLAQGKMSEGIQLLILDVDGVLTDGRLFYTENGETIKAFSVSDGQGLNLVKQAQIQLVVITGRDSPALRRRLSELGIENAYYGVKDKYTVALEVLDKLGLTWGHVAVIGDDWPDIPLFMRAAFAVAPMNAHPEIKALAHYTSQLIGGEGAVRELCDILLMAKGTYLDVFRQYACRSGN